MSFTCNYLVIGNIRFIVEEKPLAVDCKGAFVHAETEQFLFHAVFFLKIIRVMNFAFRVYEYSIESFMTINVG